METTVRQLFHDDSEEVVGILGQSYADAIIRNGELSKSIMVLSNKRLYHKGSLYEKTGNGKLNFSKGQKVVNIQDITGTSYSSSRDMIMFIISIVLGILALLGLLGIIFASIKGEAGIASSSIFLILLFGIPAMFLYSYSTKNLFVVEYSGGAIATKTAWYSTNELNEFQKLISVRKDLIKSQKDIEEESKVCPYCAEKIKANAKICRYCSREV
ncbi:MAG: hypothetical protein Q7U54_21215 [Bacteroidales bacterium]|nr:hypothetical protein [Bacteroidales bacterium]